MSGEKDSWYPSSNDDDRPGLGVFRMATESTSVRKSSVAAVGEDRLSSSYEEQARSRHSNPPALESGIARIRRHGSSSVGSLRCEWEGDATMLWILAALVYYLIATITGVVSAWTLENC
ncbi:hypothetical protein F5Y07DRAFT_397627 [Xylaria sp. FL0933]|nr:hypothetical protein F5Y07DRAFT_397627 [Xylaria sp. FL0933]